MAAEAVSRHQLMFCLLSRPKPPIAFGLSKAAAWHDLSPLGVHPLHRRMAHVAESGSRVCAADDVGR
jgi:hypothetical protein